MEGKETEGVDALVEAVKGILASAEPDNTSPGPQRKRSDADAASVPPDALASESGAKRAGDVLERNALTSKKARGAGLAKCICIVVSGLHGCGKSTLCNTLREVLDGTWLNADQIASKCKPGENGRQLFLHEIQTAFLRALAAADQNRRDRVIFLDSSNTTKKHRSDILKLLKKARWGIRGGAILFVDFSHRTDNFAYDRDGQLVKRFSEQHIDICRNRIQSRGAAQYASGLRPGPKLRTSLQSAAKAAEAVSAQELSEMDAHLSVDVSLSATEMATYVIEELRKLGWLANLRSKTDLQPRIEVAWQAYQRAEAQWSASEAAAAEESSQSQWLSQCRQALEAEKASEKAKEKSNPAKLDTKEAKKDSASSGGPVPLYWKVDLPEVSKILAAQSKSFPTLNIIEKPHTTLLYMGGETDDEALASKLNCKVDELKAWKDALEAFEGDEFEVTVTKIVLDENIAIAMVSLPPVLPCTNKVPHVTLGTKGGTPANYANELLEEVQQGRTEGLSIIELPKPRPLKGRVSLVYSTPTDSSGRS
eukprot:TRINITY_DN26928_c0_g1_i1.p1 TRINITY_DN26928_c0_g1~~TRINITY_DN26928_c0_g1_i1.p1  ORF type:complete len:592 (-),score=97.18 TRINITY_DN26928_c0_g1_i1:38-1648(-)